MKNILCYFGIHKYRANHKLIKIEKVVFTDGTSGDFETIILANPKCIRCGKIMPLPIFNEEEVEAEIRRENKEIEEENRMIYNGKKSEEKETTIENPCDSCDKKRTCISSGNGPSYKHFSSVDEREDDGRKSSKRKTEEKK